MNESLTKKVIVGTLWTAVQQWGQQFFMFVVFLILARLLDPKAFGLASLAGLFIAFTMIFATQGFTEAIVQRQPLEDQHLDSAFWGNMAVGVLLTLVNIICAGPIAKIFKEPQLVPVLRWLSLSFLINGFSAVQGSLLRRQMQFRTLAIRQLIADLTGSVVGIVMAFCHTGVWSLVGMRLTSLAVGCVVLWEVSNWRPKMRFSWQHYKHLFGFGWYIVFIGVCNFFYKESSDFFIAACLGTIALGVYNIAFNTIQRLNGVLTGAVSQVSLPAFSQVQKEPHRVVKGYFLGTEIAALIAFPVFIGIAVLAPALVPVLFGAKWNAASPLLRYLSLIGLRDTVIFLDNQVVTALGRPSWRLWLSLLNTILSITGMLIGLHWGLIGVTIGMTIAAFIFWPFSLQAVRMTVRFSLADYFARYRVPLLGSIFMTGVIWIVVRAISMDHKVLLLLAATCAGAPAYLLPIWLMKPESLRRLWAQFFPKASPQRQQA